MIDPDKISKEKLAEMNDSLIVDNNYLRKRIRVLEDELEDYRMQDGLMHDT